MMGNDLKKLKLYRLKLGLDVLGLDVVRPLTLRLCRW